MRACAAWLFLGASTVLGFVWLIEDEEVRRITGWTAVAFLIVGAGLCVGLALRLPELPIEYWQMCQACKVAEVYKTQNCPVCRGLGSVPFRALPPSRVEPDV